VVELLRKAIEWQALLASGEAPNQAAIARQEGITRARVTQVMGMLRLAPEIQEHVLSLPDLPAATGAAQAGMARRPAITERALRPIAQMADHTAQRSAFAALLEDPSRSAASA
jgi:hypothetical protein